MLCAMPPSSLLVPLHPASRETQPVFLFSFSEIAKSRTQRGQHVRRLKERVADPCTRAEQNNVKVGGTISTSNDNIYGDLLHVIALP